MNGYYSLTYGHDSLILWCGNPKHAEDNHTPDGTFTVMEWMTDTTPLAQVQLAVQKHDALHWRDSYEVIGAYLKKVCEMMGVDYPTAEEEEEEDMPERKDPEGTEARKDGIAAADIGGKTVTVDSQDTIADVVRMVRDEEGK